MPRDWLRFDPATLLATLLAGLLPSVLLVVISFACLNSISVPLLDLHDEPYRELLRDRCEHIRIAVSRRLTDLAESVQQAVDESGPETADGDWDLVRVLRWYPQGDRDRWGEVSEDERAEAEALIAEVPYLLDEVGRRKTLDAIASLPVSLVDHLGFSYAMEARLMNPHLGSPNAHLDLIREAAFIDHATLERYVELYGRQLMIPGLEIPVTVTDGPAPEIQKEGRIAPEDPSRLLYRIDSPSVFVMEIEIRPLLERVLAAQERRDPIGERRYCRLVNTSPLSDGNGTVRQSRDRGNAATEASSIQWQWPLSPPFRDYWLTTGPVDKDTLAVTILRRLQNVQYLWGGLVILALGTVTSFFLAGVVSRRVQMTRRKDDFLHLVSHELRTPIASIRMLAETLGLDRVRNEAERREFLEQLETESARLTDLVDRVIEFGRTDRGPGVREMVTDPGELVQEAVARFRERAGTEVRVTTAREFHPLLLDREAIIGVVLNLLTNARKFSAMPIEVKVGEDNRNLFVEVTDRGCGIRRREHRKIFRPFYRGERAGKLPGFGLGLAYCREVARAHRGRIRLKSAPGQGSTFTLLIPLRPAEVKGAALGEYSGS